MEIIHRNTDYALRALVSMADKGSEDIMYVREIAKTENIPQQFLYKIFQKLAKNKIVKSHRGPSGGFSLAKNPADITIKEVIEAVQGPVAINRCFMIKKSCPNIKTCEIKDRLTDIQSELVGHLEGMTLKGLLND